MESTIGLRESVLSRGPTYQLAARRTTAPPRVARSEYTSGR